MDHICNRFPSGPAFDDGNPQFPCANRDCDYRASNEDDLKPCVVCKKLFCIDGPEAGPGGCLRMFGTELFCQACAKCACGQPALISCDECGALVCADNLAKDPVRNECKKCRDDREEREYRGWISYYGSPSYGGWNRDPKDGRYKPQAVIDPRGERKPAAATRGQAEKKAEAR